MASASRNTSFHNIRCFPPVINGRININSFLEAADDLVSLVERLGTVFTPVKYDMQGNIDKIKKQYKCQEDSCLLELMLKENASGKSVAIEGILWLNRALMFFELAFEEILEHLKVNSADINMKKIFIVAYEGSVKKYHNWVTQQLFSVICKMSPSFSQVMKSFEVVDIKAFESKLSSFNITLHLIRCKIEDFFKDNSLIKETT